jgi:hypothetical protein
MMLTASIMLSAGLSAVARADEPFPNDERMPGTVDTEDGNPLDQPRLVVPDDLGGARYVKGPHRSPRRKPRTPRN